MPPLPVHAEPSEGLPELIANTRERFERYKTQCDTHTSPSDCDALWTCLHMVDLDIEMLKMLYRQGDAEDRIYLSGSIFGDMSGAELIVDMGDTHDVWRARYLRHCQPQEINRLNRAIGDTLSEFNRTAEEAEAAVRDCDERMGEFLKRLRELARQLRDLVPSARLVYGHLDPETPGADHANVQRAGTDRRRLSDLQLEASVSMTRTLERLEALEEKCPPPVREPTVRIGDSSPIDLLERDAWDEDAGPPPKTPEEIIEHLHKTDPEGLRQLKKLFPDFVLPDAEEPPPDMDDAAPGRETGRAVDPAGPAVADTPPTAPRTQVLYDTHRSGRDVESDVGAVLETGPQGSQLDVSIVSRGRDTHGRNWVPRRPVLIVDGERIKPTDTEKFYVLRESMVSAPAVTLVTAIASGYEDAARQAQDNKGTACEHSGETSDGRSEAQRRRDDALVGAALGLLVSQAAGELTGLRATFDVSGREGQLGEAKVNAQIVNDVTDQRVNLNAPVSFSSP